MAARLVLGCGSAGVGVVEALSQRPGQLRVVCRDESRVDTLRDDGVHVTVGDPADPATLDGLEDDVETVFVGTGDPSANCDILETVRSVFPEAAVVAYRGWEADAADAADIAASADRVVEPVRAVAKSIVDAVTNETGTRCRKLKTAINGIDGSLAVVMHENPDPDAIASAVALVRIAERFGVPATPCYYGEISHEENRALVNLLELDLRQLGPDEDISEFAGFALVDHSRPGVNDGLPEAVYPEIVVDHHPPRAPIEARFTDLRSEVGATSTLLTTYLTELDVGLDPTIATALLYGIRIDTDDFSREVAAADFTAAATLLPYVDAAVLEKVESPSIGGETLDVLARAIQDRDVRDHVLVSYVGRLGNRDALSQAADRLLSMQGIDATLVYGRCDGTVYVSARSRASDIDLGETLRTAFSKVGSAGGHADMAGAQIPLGILEDVGDNRDLDAAISDLVSDRFFEAVAERPVDLGVPPVSDEQYLGEGPPTDEKFPER